MSDLFKSGGLASDVEEIGAFGDEAAGMREGGVERGETAVGVEGIRARVDDAHDSRRGEVEREAAAGERSE